MAISSTNSASKGCVSDRCPPATWGDIDSAHTTGTISTVAFAAAGVGAALFVTSFVVGGTATGTTGRAAPPARIDAWVTPTSAGVGGTF
jgi:hypothetical protein